LSPPKLQPLVPPRPTPPANKALAEHQREVVQRQSDHEIKVGDSMKALIAYTTRREEHDADLARSVALLARELGIEDDLPKSLKSLGNTAPETLAKPPARVCENARKSARASTASGYGTAAIILLQIILEIVRHL